MLKRLARLGLRDGKGPWLFAAVVAVALLVTPFAVAQGGNDGKVLRGGTRNPSSNPGQNFNRETEIIANSATYGTRQSNKSNNGGGAIYGCRSRAGGTAAGNEPCIRASNLSSGRAFEFATRGAEGGRIESSSPGARPFTTNATGVATGLNADQVDGKSASDIVADAQSLTKFAAVSAAGALSAGRGAASAARTPPPAGTTTATTGDYRVVFADDVSKCAYTATVVGAEEGFATVTVVDARTLEVRTRQVAPAAAAGAASEGNALADRAFHLVVTC
jgi:hypothetical protein